MLIQLPTAVRAIVVTILVITYYLGVKQLLFAAARSLTRRVNRFPRYSRSEVQGVLELSFAVTGHVAFVIVLIAASGVQLDLGLSGNPLLLPLGALVGIAELAAAMFACQLIITAMDRSRTPSGLASASSSFTASPTSSWMSASRGGWVRHHVSSLQVLPLPISMTLSGAQVACEELVFRSVLITLFQDAGIFASIMIPAALFVAMQAFFMPSVRAAMFPVIGASIMAIVHGVLFVSIPFVWPLVIAHAVFFYVAVL